MDAAMLTVITTGFSTVQDSVTDVITVAVPALVAVIALAGGVNFALAKIKSVFHKAS